MGILVRRVIRVMRARIHVGRAERDGRWCTRGVFLTHEQLDRLVPGQTTRAEVLGVCAAA